MMNWRAYITWGKRRCVKVVPGNFFPETEARSLYAPGRASNKSNSAKKSPAGAASCLFCYLAEKLGIPADCGIKN